MRTNCLVLFLLTATASLNAQLSTIHVPVGTKFHVTTVNSTITNMTMMEQVMDNTMEMTSTQEYTVQSIRPAGYTLTGVMQKIKGSYTMMGETHTFDSDDANMKSSPMARLLDLIGKPSETIIDSGKMTMTGAAKTTPGLSSVNGMPAGMSFFFQSPNSHPKQGASWSDSTVMNGTKVVNQYVIMSVTDKEIELQMTSDMNTRQISEQGGVNSNVDMKSFSTATFIYNRSTSLLISGKFSMAITGSVDTTGTTSPVSMKSTMNITVVQ